MLCSSLRIACGKIRFYIEERKGSIQVDSEISPRIDPFGNPLTIDKIKVKMQVYIRVTNKTHTLTE